MIRLALLRHGHTEWNRAGRIQGRTDVPLDVEARRHLSMLRLPGDWRMAKVTSSPLSRAVETAQLVSGRAPVEEPALIEMDWGRWEGQRGTEMLADPTQGYRHIEEWGWSYRPPGGECPQEVADRLTPWVRQLKQDTVAVCHIGIMRVLLAQATNWDFSGPAPFRIKRDRLYVLAAGADGLAVAGDPQKLEMRTT